MAEALRYWIDKQGLICSIDGPWDEFALANCGSGATADNVLGKSLFSFIDSDGVRTVYDAMHRCAYNGKVFSFSYRCDSKDLRRDMSMRIECVGGLICYESVPITEVRHPVPITFNDDPAQLYFCSWCKEVYRLPNKDEWMPLEHIFEEDLPRRFELSHGMCKTCSELQGWARYL